MTAALTLLPAAEIARVAHEINRAYCQAIGDDSQLPWACAAAWQQEAARANVAFHLQHPDAGPEASHQAWMAKKLADGWQHGPVKRPDLKQHPALLPFEQLPAEEKAKDFLFRAVVQALSTPAQPGQAWPSRPSVGRARAQSDG